MREVVKVNPITINKNLLFGDVWANSESFISDYRASGLNVAAITDTNLTVLYCQLFARHGSDHIRSNNSNQWKYKVFANIYAKGPTWEKKMDIQTALNNLSQDDIMRGAKQVYNHAFNPSTEPSTQELEELTHINDQNVSNNKKAKMEAYSILWANLHVDATDEYLNKFKNCFSRFVADQCPILFVVED